jgi:hypothetical protein
MKLKENSHLFEIRVYFNIKSDQLKEKNKEPNSIEQKYAKDIK